MKVLQVSNLYPPYWVGGYEQIAAWVTDGLRARGHEVEVLTGHGTFDGRPDIHPDLDLDLAAFRDGYFAGRPVAEDGLWGRVGTHVFNRANFTCTRRLLREFRPDVLSFWNPAFITFSPLLASRGAGVPAVVHLSDTVANPFRNPHPPAFPERWRGVARATVDRVLRWSRPRRLVVPSAFLKEKFARTEPVPPDALEVVHWPVEPTISGDPPPPPRTSFRRLLFLGTLIPEKGPQVLLEALARLTARHRGLTLTVVGDGPEPFVAELRRRAAELPVTFLGRLDRADVIDAYRNHDLLVFPSVWDEPFAVVPLEGMAMGLLIVASRAGGTTEVVADGETGRLVEPGDAEALADAIAFAVSDPSAAASLAAAGQARVRQEHGFSAFLDRLESLYEAVRRAA